jgi:hypothetical protein
VNGVVKYTIYGLSYYPGLRQYLVLLLLTLLLLSIHIIYTLSMMHKRSIARYLAKQIPPQTTRKMHQTYIYHTVPNNSLR